MLSAATTAEAQDSRSGENNDARFYKKQSKNQKTLPSVVCNCGNQSNNTLRLETKGQPTNASEKNNEAETHYSSAMVGFLVNTLSTQTLEMHSKPKQTWIILGTNLFEESLNQVKEENQANKTKEGPEIFWNFGKMLQLQQVPTLKLVPFVQKVGE